MKEQVNDGFKSLIGNLGNPERDKRAGLQFADEQIDDEQLISAYTFNWIAKKIITIPAEDSLRQWRKWSGDDAKAIHTEEQRLGLECKLNEALTKARLFGGAAIYIGTDQEQSEALDVESIGLGDIKYLTVLTRRELQAGELEQDPQNEFYGKPKEYTISGGSGDAIHPSRFALLNGDEVADTWLASGMSYGWGESVLKSTSEAIKNAGGTFANVASLVYESNIDVIGVPDLMDNIGQEGYENNLLKRFSLAAMGKGINGTLIMDALETYNRKSTSFAQLTEIMSTFSLHCAAAADIPATRFLSQSASGLTATGEGDMKNYHDKLKSMQKLKIQPAMHLLDLCLVRSALNSYPDDVSCEWNPLEQMSEEQIAGIEKTKAESLKIVAELDTAIIPMPVIYEQQRKMGLFDGTDIATFADFESALAKQAESMEMA